MGARKRIKADEMKKLRKKVAFAKLNNCPTSPRKMRLLADLIRGLTTVVVPADHDPSLESMRSQPRVFFALDTQNSIPDGLKYFRIP